MSPSAPLKVCATPGCPNHVIRGHCPQHAQPAFSRSTTASQRIRGRRLQQLRNDLFSDQPFCVGYPKGCHGTDRILASVRDHVTPLSEGGTDDPANIQPLCKRCSDKKTGAESARGRARYR